MDHLPQLSDSTARRTNIPYICQPGSTSVSDFFQYPEKKGWNLKLLEVGLKNNSYLALRTAKKNKNPTGPKELAALLQDWWYFGLLSAVLEVEIDHSDFLQSDGNGGSSITTKNLRSCLNEWESQISSLEPQEAFERLQKSKRYVDHVHQSIQFLGQYVEAHDIRHYHPKPVIAGIRKAVDGRVSVSNTTLDTIINLRRGTRATSSTETIFEQSELFHWATNGRIILPEELELGICILGMTLSHAISNIYHRLNLSSRGELKHQGWYTPKSVHRRLLENGVCPRLISRLQPSLLLVGMQLSSQLKLVHEPRKETDHENCTRQRCDGDYLSEILSVRWHTTPNCPCTDFPSKEVLEQVFSILENGAIPLLRFKLASLVPSFEVVPHHNQQFVAISHVWSDGLGNPEANQIYECQWKRLQHLVDTIFPGDILEASNFFWLDTICVPVAPPEYEWEWSDWERRKRLRQYAIERMRETYCDAYSVLILDNDMLALEAENIPSVEFGLRFSFSKWMRRLWTMHEGAMARLGRLFVRTRDGCVRLESVFQDLLDQVRRGQTTLGTSLLYDMGSMEALQAWASMLHADAANRTKDYLQSLFIFTWNESRTRGTKYEEDRYVVMASVLGIAKPQELYDCKKEDRAKLLFSKALAVPAQLLFTRGPRIPDAGMRWAPVDIDCDKIEMVTELPPAIRTNFGIRVRFEGWHLESHPQWHRRYSWNGSWTKILNSSSEAAEPGVSYCAWIVCAGETGPLYTIQFREPTDQDPPITPADRLAIVLQHPFYSHYTNTRAVLVAEDIEEEGVIYARFIAPLSCGYLSTEDQQLIRQGIEGGDYDLCQVSKIGNGAETPEWCID